MITVENNYIMYGPVTDKIHFSNFLKAYTKSVLLNVKKKYKIIFLNK